MCFTCAVRDVLIVSAVNRSYSRSTWVESSRMHGGFIVPRRTAAQPSVAIFLFYTDAFLLYAFVLLLPLDETEV